MVTIMKDVSLEFLEERWTHGIWEDRELQQAILEDDKMFQVGGLYFPDIHVNIPQNWKSGLLDGQALVSRRRPPCLFLTVTMNTKLQVLKHLGLDIENSSRFSPVGDKPRLFDTFVITARVYNQFQTQS